MNIHRLYSRTAASGASDASGPDRTRTRPTSPVAPTTAHGGASDSVQLSDDARAHQAEAAAHKAEVEAARTALRAQPGLSDERATEIRQRVADGYYDRPEVIAETADKLAGAFRGL